MWLNKTKNNSVSGLHFHVIGEGVVRVRSQRAERVYDKENYIDFRMRLLGEPGIYIIYNLLIHTSKLHTLVNIYTSEQTNISLFIFPLQETVLRCCRPVSTVFRSSSDYPWDCPRLFSANTDGCSIIARPPSENPVVSSTRISRSSSSWIPLTWISSLPFWRWVCNTYDMVLQWPSRGLDMLRSEGGDFSRILLLVYIDRLWLFDRMDYSWMKYEAGHFFYNVYI